MASPTSLAFTVRRQPPQLVAPAKPTPRELKPLSDIHDQQGLRFQLPGLLIYKNVPSMEGKDPVRVIRDALAQTLVFYYPLAGRLREGPGRKLSVDCTGEGVVFIEGDADVRVEDFGEVLLPPFPCMEELLFDDHAYAGVLDSPLVIIHVTRLMCGGFIFAIRINHTMSDAFGMYQFLSAVGEMACGAHAPSIAPIWKREIFSARNPPRVTCTHHEFDDVEGTITLFSDMARRLFVFGKSEVSALRKILPEHLSMCSAIEIITACLWRCRTLALQIGPEEEVRLSYVVNARGNKLNPPVPTGYYGNAFAFPAALTTAGKLCKNPIGYALELVRKAKADVTNEYMQSLADLLVIKGRPLFTMVRSYTVSDLTRSRFGDVDFGWGKPGYGGPLLGGYGYNAVLGSFYLPFRNHKGEDEIVVPICLPSEAMEKFEKELNGLLSNDQKVVVDTQKSRFIMSKV